MRFADVGGKREWDLGYPAHTNADELSSFPGISHIDSDRAGPDRTEQSGKGLHFVIF